MVNRSRTLDTTPIVAKTYTPDELAEIVPETVDLRGFLDGAREGAAAKSTEEQQRCTSRGGTEPRPLKKRYFLQVGEAQHQNLDSLDRIDKRRPARLRPPLS